MLYAVLLWNAMFKIYIIRIRRYCLQSRLVLSLWQHLFCLGFILVVNNTAKLFIICTLKPWYFYFYVLGFIVWIIYQVYHLVTSTFCILLNSSVKCDCYRYSTCFPFLLISSVKHLYGIALISHKSVVLRIFFYFLFFQLIIYSDI